MECAAPSLVFATEVNLFRGKQGDNIVHLPLAGRAFKVSEGARAVIEKVKKGVQVGATAQEVEILGRLAEMGLFATDPDTPPQVQPIERFTPTEATLIFTESCNLACAYCYASSGPAKSEPMSDALMRAAVDLVCENTAGADKGVASFRYIGGGEPSLEWDLLERTTAYIEETSERWGVRHFIRLITNGTLLTADRIEWLADHIQFVTLSFDILPELQMSRPYAGGRSTQAKLLDVVRRLRAAGVAFHLRTTISVEAASRLEEMVQYAHDHCGATSIRFEPMSAVGRSVTGGVEKPTETVFVESFKAAVRLGKRLGIDVTCKMFSNLIRRSARFCDAEFTITPAGAVSGCHRYSREDHDGFDLFKIGEYDGSSFRFDVERINALRAINVRSFRQCDSCFARWNCAGGCLSARMRSGEVAESGPLCHLTRELLKFSIEERLGG